MKRVCLVFMFMLLLIQTSHAQRGRRSVSRMYTEFQYGFLQPNNTDPGRLIGLSTGRRLDDRIFWGGEVYYFSTTFRKSSEVADSVGAGIKIRTRRMELEFKTVILPLLFKLDYEIPFQYQGPLLFRASGAIGWELIWNRERNFVERIERVRFFHGMGFQVSAGIGLKISRAGTLFLDGYYNLSEASREDAPVKGFPISQVVDVSGGGFKLGIRLQGLGFRRLFKSRLAIGG